MLTIEPGLLIWTIITFIVLFLVLRAIAWRPILAALEQRETTIRTSLDEAQQARQEAQQLLVQHQQMIAEMQRESGRILDQAREEGQRLRDTMAEQTREESQRLREEARREIQRERQLAVQELKNTAADLALTAAGQLLGTTMTSDDHRRLVREFLDRFPERLDG
jgi:F-type H+-transporting ATPase subunit b